MRGGIAISVLLIGGLAACAGSQLPPELVRYQGAQLFNGYLKPDVDCYRCHDGDATGTMFGGPNLVERLSEITNTDIVHAIQEGPGDMHTFWEQLTDAEVTEIAAWLRSLAPPPPAPPPPPVVVQPVAPAPPPPQPPPTQP